MYLLSSIFSLTVSKLMLSSALNLTSDQASRTSASSQIVIGVSKKTQNLSSSKRKNTRNQLIELKPYFNLKNRKLIDSPKKKGKKSKKADCKVNHSKSPKSSKNSFKKNKGKKKLKSSCFRISSKAPVRLIPPPKAKKPFIKESTVIARTSSIGTMVQVAFNSSLTFSRFPKPRSQDETSTIINILTLAFKNILPDGSSVELTHLSNKTRMNSNHTRNFNRSQANRMLLRFSTLSHPMECAGVSCIQVGDQLYDKTAQSLQQSVTDTSLVSEIQYQALTYQSVDFKNLRVNPQSLHVGNFKLVANQREPISQYSTTSSSKRQQITYSNKLFCSVILICSVFQWF